VTRRPSMRWIVGMAQYAETQAIWNSERAESG
jgi:hypothetical protein